jgi:hypothetical protein
MHVLVLCIQLYMSTLQGGVSAIVAMRVYGSPLDVASQGQHLLVGLDNSGCHSSSNNRNSPLGTSEQHPAEQLAQLHMQFV